MYCESDLTDEQWEKIQPMLPPPAHTGRPRADDRSTINGIFYVLSNRCRWRDIPKRYGSHITCWRRHRNWSRDGTLARIMEVVREDGHFDESWDEDEEEVRSVG